MPARSQSTLLALLALASLASATPAWAAVQPVVGDPRVDAAAGPLTFFIIVDGLGNDVFQEFSRTTPGSAIASTMSGARLDYVAGSTSAFPSYTFPNQVTLVTGRWPGGPHGHGIPGNAWFDRSGAVRGNTPPTAPADVREYDAGTYMQMGTHAAYVYLPPGLLNRDLRGDTLYDALGAAGKTSFVSYHMVTKGADAFAWPLPQDYVMYVGVSGEAGSAQYDRASGDATVAAIHARAASGMPFFDHVTVYFSGLDHAGHTETGKGSMVEYLRETVDPQVARIRDALALHGLLDRVVWTYAADHGHTEMQKDDWVDLASPAVRDGILEKIPCGSEPCYRAAYEPSYAAGAVATPPSDATRTAYDLVMLNNGGAGFLYLASRAARDAHGLTGAQWDAAPDLRHDAMPLVRGLAREAITSGSPLFGTLDDVLVKVCGHACAYRVYRPEAHGELAPVGVLNPAYLRMAARLAATAGDRSPDVILLPNYLARDGWPPAGHHLNAHGTLADDRTRFFDRQIEHSTHGSAYRDDSAPVLQIGTTGGALGFHGRRLVHDAPWNVDVAPTLAGLHGVHLRGDGVDLLR